MMRFKFLISAVVLAVIVYGAFWYTLAEEAEDRIDQWADRIRESGYSVRYDLDGVSGFPYRLVVNLSDLHISARQTAPDWRWRAREMRATVLPWQPRHVVIAAAENAIELGADDEPYHISVPVVRASIVFGDDEDRYSVDLGAVDIRPYGDGSPSIAMTRGQIHIRVPDDRPGDDGGLLAPLAARLAIDAERVDLGEFASPVLGPQIDYLRVETEIHGRPIPGLRHQQMRIWAESGGTVEITKADLKWGDLEIVGEGSVTVDEINRPLGALTLKARNPVLLSRHLRATQLIHPQTAQLADEVLHKMQTAAGTKPVELPLTMQNGALELGPIHLLNMPSL